MLKKLIIRQKASIVLDGAQIWISKTPFVSSGQFVIAFIGILQITKSCIPNTGYVLLMQLIINKYMGK